MMRLTEKWKSIIEKIGITLSFFGLFSILQPISMTLYRYGFQILCLGGIIYIVLGYIPTGAPLKKGLALTLAVLAVLAGFLALGIFVAPILVG